MAATIRTKSFGDDQKHLQEANVTLEVSTSAGSFDFLFRFEDQGSAQTNEARARQRLRTFLREALAVLDEKRATGT
jgi:hypothetical protein